MDINEEGYDSLKDFVMDNWNIHELRDDEGNVVTRLNPNDDRVEWSESGNTLTISTTLNGGDSDVEVPVTITDSLIYESGTDNPIMDATLSDSVTISDDASSRKINHQINL